MNDQIRPLLVVEDDGLIRMDLADLLADGGYRVLEAANAEQAIMVLEREKQVSALLTDIDMPGSLNGIALANLAAEKWPDCRIIVISGRYSPDQGSLPEGARFLSKPIGEKLLHETLAEMNISP